MYRFLKRSSPLHVAAGFFILFFLISPIYIKTDASLYIDSRAGVYIVEFSESKVILVQNEELILERPVPFGSLIKPFTLYHAISSGKITPDKTFTCESSSPYQPSHMRCWYTPGHGTLDCRQALAFSCNRFFMKMSAFLDYESFILMLEKFGFDTRTIKDVDDPLERKMIMTGLDARFVEIPSMLLFRLSALFENGMIYRPDKDYKIVYSRLVELEKNAVEVIHDGMEMNNLTGTGSIEAEEALFNLKFWSKTGTSCSVEDPENKTDGYFYAYFPKGGRRYALIIVLPDAKGDAAASIGRRVIYNLSLLN